ncbi:MAG TPA: MobF family relaxase [Microthrixaceae bacterium]|nr:relaxase domain-containing protein [Microthrixaceae bacterium]HPG13501.1 MobF family relaxase [Microthrixaceae bacterium]
MAAVMRVTTLKASADRLDGLSYYAGLAEDRGRPGLGRGPVDYYLDPDEPPGRWWGSGRGALGLDGVVAGEDLRVVLEGRHPGSGAGLGRRFGDTSARGFDATFSAPKSVSVLWALSPDSWVRAEVLAAHDAAVDAALGWFECHGAVTRRGTDGVFQVDTQGLTAALFRQHTSRTIDPQLHTHAVISAKVQDPTGRWLSLDARFLKYQQRTIGWIYDAALRAELTNRLGVTWAEPGDGARDLTCIPAEVNAEFSTRTTQVDAKLTELVRRWSYDHDGADPDARTIAGLQRAAVVASRPAKGHGFDPSVLRLGWEEHARAIGFDPDHLTADELTARQPEASRVPDEDLIDEALMRVSEESSTWLRADLARHLATLLDPRAGANGAALVAEVDRLAELAERLCAPLGPEPDGAPMLRADDRPVTEHVTDRRFSTHRILREEQDLQTWAETNTRHIPLNGDARRDAAEAIAGHAPLVVLVGPAGTGKTRTTATAVAELQELGRPVIGLAPSGKAADVLCTEADCSTDTLAGFLTRHRHRRTKWPAGTTVILDEAGMTATADLAQLVHLVRVNRWRLVAVGDPEQLPSVARGGVFAHWCNTVAHHTLDTPRRFSEPWEATASLGLRAGHPAAVQLYTDHRRLHTAHPALVAGQVARAHQHHTASGRSVAITTNTAETATAINQEIQHLTRRTGSPGVMLHDGTTARPGDRIATRRNDPRLRTDGGERVRNRHTWTVQAVHAGGAIVATDDQRGTVTLPADYVNAHVELGWAVTGYGNQGDTVDIGIAVLEPTSSRNHAYVAMTRGREANHALILDRTGTTDPAERLAEIITRPTRAHSALATQQRLHRDAGVEPPTLDDMAEPPKTTVSGEPPTVAPELDEKVAAITRRLDALQRRAPSRDGQGLGL